jgi:hypothetical protein
VRVLTYGYDVDVEYRVRGRRGSPAPKLFEEVVIERAREDWKGEASHVHFGRCDGCGRTHTDDGKPLLVARRRRSAKGFRCFTCWFVRDGFCRVEGQAA